MKISNGAVEAAARAVCLDAEGYEERPITDYWKECETWEDYKAAGASVTRRVLTYYTEHPDELPEGFTYQKPYETGEAVDYFCNKCGVGSGTFEKGGVRHDGCSYFGAPMRRTMPVPPMPTSVTCPSCDEWSALGLSDTCPTCDQNKNEARDARD